MERFSVLLKSKESFIENLAVNQRTSFSVLNFQSTLHLEILSWKKLLRAIENAKINVVKIVGKDKKEK